MGGLRLTDRLTGPQWLRRMFEYENCEECGRGARGHVAVPFLGNWFAACKRRIDPMNRQPREVLIIGENTWGRGVLFDDAKKEYKKASGRLDRYTVYDVPPGTRVDDLGRFEYAEEYGDAPPMKLKTMANGMEVK